MGNIHLKLFEIWTSGSAGDAVFKKKFTEHRWMDKEIMWSFLFISQNNT